MVKSSEIAFEPAVAVLTTQFFTIWLTGKTEKTNIYDILTKDNYWLGEVRWKASWHRYAFYPRPDTVFSSGCQRDIADFCDKMTVEHRRMKQKPRTFTTPTGTITNVVMSY